MKYQCGAYIIDKELSEITYNEEVISQDEKKVKLLSVLIEQAPNTISKETLMNELWPDAIVSEASLSKLVSEVRKLFNQFEQENPIRTVHRKGYKYALRVMSDAQDNSTEHSQVACIPEKGPFIHSRRVYSALLMVSLAFVAFLGFQYFKRAPITPSIAILWVDDNPKNNSIETQYFSQLGIKTYTARSTEDALKLLSMYDYELVISDMGRGNDYIAGLNLLKGMRKTQNATPFILYSSPVSEQKRQLVKMSGGQYAIENRERLYRVVFNLISKDNLNQ